MVTKMKKPKRIQKVIHVILIIYIVLSITRILIYLGGIKNLFVITQGIGNCLLILVVTMHMADKLGRNSILFATISFSIGLIAELAGTIYGIPFGKYYYTDVLPLKIFGLVPLTIPLMWMSLSYIAYSTTNIMVTRPQSVLLLSSLDGLCLVAFDLLADPVAVGFGLWVWINESPYYGIPLSNFLGWFLVTFTITSIYRLMRKGVTEFDRSAYIPTVCLFLLVLNTALNALYLGYFKLVVTGSLATAPFILLPFLKLKR